MIASLRILIENKEDIRLNHNISSLLHGFLMELIDEDYADILHETGLKPYSQYIEFSGNIINWNISTLTDEAKNNIIDRLLDDKIQIIYLKHKNLSLKILKKNLELYSYEQLLNENYFADSKRYINVNFVTPTAFKSQGNYIFYPNIKLIYQSLMNKFDKCSIDTSIYNEEVLEHLVDNTIITKYQLKSTIFHMEGIKIPSFLGHITIRINGPQAMANLANLLFIFGEYSGIGIKSAVGMGGIKIIEQKGGVL